MAGWIHKGVPSRYIGGMAGWVYKNTGRYRFVGGSVGRVYEPKPPRYVGGMVGWVSCQAAASAAPEPGYALASWAAAPYWDAETDEQPGNTVTGLVRTPAPMSFSDVNP